MAEVLDQEAVAPANAPAVEEPPAWQDVMAHPKFSTLPLPEKEKVLDRWTQDSTKFVEAQMPPGTDSALLYRRAQTFKDQNLGLLRGMDAVQKGLELAGTVTAGLQAEAQRAQQWQQAAGYTNAFLRGRPAEVVAPDIRLPVPRELMMNVISGATAVPKDLLEQSPQMRGLSQAGADFVSSLTSPENLAFLGAMAAEPDAFINRLVTLGFSGLMAKNTYDQTAQLLANRQNLTTEELWRGIGGIVSSGAMATFVAKHGIGPEHPAVAEAKTALPEAPSTESLRAFVDQGVRDLSEPVKAGAAAVPEPPTITTKPERQVILSEEAKPTAEVPQVRQANEPVPVQVAPEQPIPTERTVTENAPSTRQEQVSGKPEYTGVPQGTNLPAYAGEVRQETSRPAGSRGGPEQRTPEQPQGQPAPAQPQEAVAAAPAPAQARAGPEPAVRAQHEQRVADLEEQKAAALEEGASNRTISALDKRIAAARAEATAVGVTIPPRTSAEFRQPEQNLTDSLGALEAEQGKLGAKLAEEGEAGPTLGITPSPIIHPNLGGFMEAVKAAGREITKIATFTPFKESINRWVSRNQQSVMAVRKIQSELERLVPRKDRREGITNYIQANGDAQVLRDRARASKLSLRKGYDAALNLTPQEKQVADYIRQFYDQKLSEAQQYGIVQNGLENYVTQVWKQPVISTKQFAQFAGKLAKTFKFGRQRSFESFFAGEQAGWKPATKDISKLVGLYVHEMNKVIATRDLIKDLTTKTAADGRPLVAPTGSATVIEGKADPNDPSTILVKPRTKAEDFGDYKTIPNPALSKWKWGTTDEAGNTVLVDGQLALHPDIYDNVKNALGRSAIREWMTAPSPPLKAIFKSFVRGTDAASRITKQTMLDISPFHYVQEATHAIGHKVSPFWDLPKLDASDPKQIRAMDHGLMMAGDHVEMQRFVEGVGGGTESLLRKIPYAGDYIKVISDFLFNEYIPRLKYKTYDAMLRRNTERFKTDLASGKVSIDDVEYLSAQQANAAYGHLNYADIGRNPTMQHLLRLTLLAPDFLEARGRFSAQALKPGKSGTEQRMAMALLATTFFVTARILNKTLDDDWHLDEPFGVKVGGRLFTMRSVPEDIWRLFGDSRKFIYGRLNPILGQGVVQSLSGKNYRGEKVSWTDTFADLATRWIPISIRMMPGLRNLNESTRNNPVSPWEQFLSSVGLQISRNSPISETYKLADKWKKSVGIKEDTGTYPVSKYQQLRYSLEDNNMERAKAEYEKLLGETTGAVRTGPDAVRAGFKESLMHAFTGSKTNDEKFRASLKEPDRKLFDEAQRKRQDIWARFQGIAGPEPEPRTPLRPQGPKGPRGPSKRPSAAASP